MSLVRKGLVLWPFLGFCGFSTAALASGPDASVTSYHVKHGDCLWKIAARKEIFGDPWKWPLLHEANRGLIKNPDLIEIGWELRVPLSADAGQVSSALEFARAYKEEKEPPQAVQESAASAPANRAVTSPEQGQAAEAGAQAGAPMGLAESREKAPNKTWLWAAILAAVLAVLYFLFRKDDSPVQARGAPNGTLAMPSALAPPMVRPVQILQPPSPPPAAIPPPPVTAALPQIEAARVAIAPGQAAAPPAVPESAAPAPVLNDETAAPSGPATQAEAAPVQPSDAPAQAPAPVSPPPAQTPEESQDKAA